MQTKTVKITHKIQKKIKSTVRQCNHWESGGHTDKRARQTDRQRQRQRKRGDVTTSGHTRTHARTHARTHTHTHTLRSSCSPLHAWAFSLTCTFPSFQANSTWDLLTQLAGGFFNKTKVPPAPSSASQRTGPEPLTSQTVQCQTASQTRGQSLWPLRQYNVKQQVRHQTKKVQAHIYPLWEANQAKHITSDIAIKYFLITYIYIYIYIYIIVWYTSLGS